MHIAYIHQHFATRNSATGTRSYEMSRHLLAAGHRVSLICGVNEATTDLLEAAQQARQFSVDGIDVHCVPELYANSMGFSRRVLAFLKFMRAATRIVAGLDADLVFATSTPLTVGIPGMRGARRLRAPFVFEVRDLWPDLPIEMGILRNPALIWYTRRLERRIYFAAQRIIALSPGMRDGICARGYPPERVTMVPNGCDLDLFRPSAAPLDDPRFGRADEFRLVFTGAHGLANGLDAVLDAARELRRRGVNDVRFVFIGQGGQRERLMKRAHEEGTADMTAWIPFIPKQELAELLPRFGAGMMILKNVRAFYHGTSPNKFFDYIASGLPVLNNYPGWVADMIRDAQCGLAVPPDDPAAFADAVVKLRDDPHGRRQMGLSGRALAEERFDRAVLATQFRAVLEKAYEEFTSRRACA